MKVGTHKKYWIQLKRLADQNDVVGFFKLYKECLENCNVISPSRTILYEMICKLQPLLENKNEI